MSILQIYINTNAGEFPNFKFIESLKNSLKNDNGTIFRFATHENSILNAIKDQLESSSFPNKVDLIEFIKTIATPRNDESKSLGPIKTHGGFNGVVILGLLL